MTYDKKTVTALAKDLRLAFKDLNIKQTAHNHRPSIKESFATKNRLSIFKKWGYFADKTVEECESLDRAYEKIFEERISQFEEFAKAHGAKVIVTDNSKPDVISNEARVIRIVFPES